MTAKTSSHPRPLKVVSEVAREHETFRYDPSLVDDYRVNDTGQPWPSSELRTSGDGVMTALAQLGLYQTGAERAFVSLFDANHQYVVAEALPRTTLLPHVSNSDSAAQLSCCGTAIPRTNNLCEQVLRELAPTYGSQQQKGAIELPVTLISDLSIDTGPMFNPGGEGLNQFYAAVPIRTRRGINIGVYCVLGPMRDEEWDDECARCLREVSSAILEYLEARAARFSSRRNERLNRGLGSFVEGESTILGWEHGPNEAAYANQIEPEGRLDAEQQHHLHHERQAQDSTQYMPDARQDDTAPKTITEREVFGERFDVASKATGSNPSPGNNGIDAPYKQSPVSFHSGEPGDSSLRVNDTQVFSKAANIIREAFEVAGCLFFDVSLGSHRSPNFERDDDDLGEDDNSSHLSATSSSDDQPSAGLPKGDDAACELLGYSTSDASSINSTDLDMGTSGITRRFLAKMLHRYPTGKIYTFDAAGELQSSDSSGEESTQKELSERRSVSRQNSDVIGSGTGRRSQSKSSLSRSREGSLIYKLCPGARSVAFMPVWDSKRERWIAGGFIYTLTPTRVFTVEGELSFLQGFAQLIAAEVLKHRTMQADRAKADALGSLSHELRSPMHGIILGTELLNDTELTVFQGSAIHTIETCCRTLLDTIDHLLDYAKVNNLRAQYKNDASAVSPRTRRRNKLEKRGMRMPSTAVMLDGLVEEVVDSVFAGFNFQHMSVRQLAKTDISSWMDTAAHQRLDSANAIEQLSLEANGKGERTFHFGRLSVHICIEPSCEWMFYVHPGAMRRVIMNLFGNALKFTVSGNVWVILRQKKYSDAKTRTDSVIELTIKDTGPGISDEYLQHSLFKPFAQENELASGTGLGLSIVKKIVSQLRGDLSVESQVGVGTTVTVTLRLQRPSSAFRASLTLVEEDEAFQTQLQELVGMRARLVGFETQPSPLPAQTGRAIMEDICSLWLRLDMTPEEMAHEMLPDIMIWSADALPSSSEDVTRLGRFPNIVICQDALDAYQRGVTHESKGEEGIFEFISQPVGPRKLAKSILLAYRRWVGVSRSVGTSRLPLSKHQSYNENPGRTRQSEQDPRTKPALAAEPRISEDATTPTHLGDSPQSNIQEQLALPRKEPSAAFPPEPSSVGNCFLLVDDNKINLKMLSACVTRLGQAHETAANGQQAVDAYKLQPSRFAAILMDISMPVMDGLEATRRIRAYEHQHHLARVPVLTLTGLGSGETQREAIECGVDRFLTKPVRLNVLSEALEAMGVVVGRA